MSTSSRTLKISLCFILLLSILYCGCISSGTSSGLAGTYTGIDHPNNVIVLNADGTAEIRYATATFQGNYTVKNTSLFLTKVDDPKSSTTMITTLNPNGTFSIGMVTFQKTS